MKILVTGMTPTQAGRPGRFQWLTVPALLAEALRAGGHEVEHREYVPGEDLRPYGAVLIGLVPVSSIAARHVYGTLDLITRCHGGAVPVVRYYVDDWQFDKIMGAARNKHKQGGANLFTTIKGRTHREWAETPEGRLQVALGCEILATTEWPTTISVAYPWGDTSKLPTLPAEKMIYIDPSALCWDKYTFFAAPTEERVKRWVFGTLSDQRKWIESQHFTWPVEMVGPPPTGAERTLKEPELIQLVAESWGALTPPYRALAGTGWWRSRFLYTAKAGAVNYLDPTDAVLIGPATAWAANNLCSLETLPPDRLADLARVQLEELRAVTWSREQLVEEMFAAVVNPSAFVQLMAPTLADVGTVMTRMDQAHVKEIVARNPDLGTYLIQPQEIRRPETKRDVER